MLSQGIETAIHYPTPIHLQTASKKLAHKMGDFPLSEKQSDNILSLPIHQGLQEFEINKIINEINKFLN